MRVVIQRVLESKVTVDNFIRAETGVGLLIFVGVEIEDTQEDIDYLVKKTINLRLFYDTKGKMNHSINQVGGEILVVSQFTLHAKTHKGNRPSFTHAAKSEQAIVLYNKFCVQLNTLLKTELKTGAFGADMQVQLVNDGPVTLLLDSKNRQ